MTYIVDASVAMKWIAPEELRDQALMLLDDTSLLEAPDLIILEATNIAWKKCLRGEMSQEQARNVVPAIQRLINVIHPSQRLCERALDIALTLNHPIYDCLYIACAEVSGGVLVTADKRLCRAVESTPHASRVRHLADESLSPPCPPTPSFR